MVATLDRFESLEKFKSTDQIQVRVKLQCKRTGSYGPNRLREFLDPESRPQELLCTVEDVLLTEIRDHRRVYAAG